MGGCRRAGMEMKKGKQRVDIQTCSLCTALINGWIPDTFTASIGGHIRITCLRMHMHLPSKALAGAVDLFKAEPVRLLHGLRLCTLCNFMHTRLVCPTCVILWNLLFSCTSRRLFILHRLPGWGN